MDYKNCEENTRNKIIPVKENGRKFTVNNKNQICVSKVKVDKCLITGNRKKCDWLFEFDKTVLYVELKGTCVRDGCKQILSTIEYCVKNGAHIDYTKKCCIVPKSVPRNTRSYIQKIKNELMKSYQATLNTIVFEVSI